MAGAAALVGQQMPAGDVLDGDDVERAPGEVGAGAAGGDVGDHLAGRRRPQVAGADRRRRVDDDDVAPAPRRRARVSRRRASLACRDAKLPIAAGRPRSLRGPRPARRSRTRRCGRRAPPRRLEHRPGAVDVDALHGRRVGARVAVERGEVEDASTPVERPAQRVAVEHVAGHEVGAGRQRARFAAVERTHRRAAGGSASTTWEPMKPVAPVTSALTGAARARCPSRDPSRAA